MKKRVKCDSEQSSFSTNENERVQKDNSTDWILMIQVPLQTAWETSTWCGDTLISLMGMLMNTNKIYYLAPFLWTQI